MLHRMSGSHQSRWRMGGGSVCRSSCSTLVASTFLILSTVCLFAGKLRTTTLEHSVGVSTAPSLSVKSPLSLRRSHRQRVKRRGILPSNAQAAPPPPNLGKKASSSSSSSLFQFGGRRDEGPYEAGKYDHEKAAEYYRKRWWLTLSRGSMLATRLGLWSWSTKVLDKNMGKEEENKELRSRELLDIINDVGPTAIKIGQALSIRNDLVDPVYAATLSELQDRVPPFPNAVAMKVIEEDLGVSINDVFEWISPEPVAAASIGQVYKARLKSNNKEVAVKVQRPGVLPQIALDLHIARSFAPTWKKLLKANTDFVGLVDEWGAGFIQELDYLKEAKVTKEFTEAMKKRELDAVSAPEVIDSLTNKRVLTTAWVEGIRLDRADSGDAKRLSAVALNAYLTMLLDTGTLHCDPHPGNLLRTPEGRLCILDFGMTTSIRSDLQYALLEYIAHLVTKEYSKVPDDLVNLGFVPKGQEEMIKKSGVVEILSFTLTQLAKGGGAKKTQQRMVDELKAKYGDISREEMRLKIRETLKKDDSRVGVADVGKTFEDLEKSQPNLFQIPTWMAYILRAFSVLEGIGLNADEEYSIVNECYPYLAKRLLTDNHPRAVSALRTILYGGGGAPSGLAGGGGMLNMEQVERMSAGFSSFSQRSVSVSESEGLDAAAEQFATLVLSREGTFLQTVLLEELSAVLDAAARAQVSGFLSSFPGSVLTQALSTQRRLTKQLPSPLQTLLTPVLFPGDVVSSLYPLVAPTNDDKSALEAAEKLASLVNAQLLPPPSSSSIEEERQQQPPLAVGAGAAAVAPAEGGGEGKLGGGAIAPPPTPPLSNLEQLQRSLPSLLSSGTFDRDNVQSFIDKYGDLAPGAQATALRLAQTILKRARERTLDAANQVESRAQLPLSLETSRNLIKAINDLLKMVESQIGRLSNAVE